MLRRSLRTTRTSRDGDTPAGGPATPPGETVVAGADEGSPLIAEEVTPPVIETVLTSSPVELPDLTTSLPVIDAGTVMFITDTIEDGVAARPDPSGPVATFGQGLPRVDEDVPVVGGAAVEPDLLRDALLIEGPSTAPVTRRAQHHRRWRSSAGGQHRIGLAAVTLSAATVAVLAAGTVQGLRADDQRALLGQSTLAGRDGATPDMLGGRDEDAISPRRSTLVVAQEAQQALRAQAAERIRAEADAAAQQAAQQAAAQQAAQQAVAQAVAQQRAAAAAKARQDAAQQASRSSDRTVPVSGGSAQAIAQALLAQRGWSGQWTCLNRLWQRESGWNYQARNPSSGAYGIPQALPGGKMASAGADWATNPATQIRWGLSYIAATYGTPCGAWAHSQATGWY